MQKQIKEEKKDMEGIKMNKETIYIQGPIDEETGIPIWEYWEYEEGNE